MSMIKYDYRGDGASLTADKWNVRPVFMVLIISYQPFFMIILYRISFDTVWYIPLITRFMGPKWGPPWSDSWPHDTCYLGRFPFQPMNFIIWYEVNGMIPCTNIEETFTYICMETHITVSELNHNWFRECLVFGSTPCQPMKSSCATAFFM